MCGIETLASNVDSTMIHPSDPLAYGSYCNPRSTAAYLGVLKLSFLEISVVTEAFRFTIVGLATRVEIIRLI